mgnify:CR=1 FL=1
MLHIFELKESKVVKTLGDQVRDLFDFVGSECVSIIVRAHRGIFAMCDKFSELFHSGFGFRSAFCPDICWIGRSIYMHESIYFAMHHAISQI